MPTLPSNFASVAPFEKSKNVTFQSIQTIYEYRYVCTMAPMDFNYPINPTAMHPVLFTTGSDAARARYWNSSSMSPVNFLNLISSGTAGMGDGNLYGSASIAAAAYTPYFTTVGLYTDQQELVAVAKFPRAIQRVSDSNVNQSVIIKFDV